MVENLWYSRADFIPVLGHRGVCARYPENTLVSFQAALDLGCDLIEFDINITSDGIPVVIHDKTIALVQEFGIWERTVIACFHTETMLYIQQAHPQIRTQGLPCRFMPDAPMEMYDRMFGIGIPIGWKDCTDAQIAEDVAFAKAHNILPWLFCADTEEDVLRCIKHGCANITGNNPEVALQTLRKLRMHK